MLPNKTWANSIDGHIRRLVKKALCLPKSANSAFIHCPWKFGGLGVPCVEDDLKIAWASQAYKYLTNKDNHVKSVATQQLLHTTKLRTTCSSPTPDDVLKFVNESSTKAVRHNDIRSLWSLLPGCLAPIGAKFQSGSSWKKSVKVLAYKNRGDKQDLSSWRPICLQNTIYKLYAACIARELLLGPWR